ncbi:MAG: hypothetical protein NTY19_44420 [Planctomycetota bacterium]|nr:hypothetical protein [Planctomycetota bacterium]
MDEKLNIDTQVPVERPSRLDAQQGVEANMEELTELRERKNLEYLRSVLRAEDPLTASVGALTGDLLNFANHMQRMIMPALRRLSAEPGAFAKVVPAVEAYGRVARQVERLSVLTERLHHRQEAAVRAANKMKAVEVGLGPAATQTPGMV